MPSEELREFEQFIERNKAYAYAAAFASCGDFPTAKRIAGQAFADAYESSYFRSGSCSARLDDGSNGLNWLRESVREQVSDSGRDLWRGTRRDADPEAASSEAASMEGSHTVSCSLKVRVHRAVLKAVRSLAEEQKIVAVLHWTEGMPHEEIAELLDVSQEKVDGDLAVVVEAVVNRLAEGIPETAHVCRRPVEAEATRSEGATESPSKGGRAAEFHRTGDILDLLETSLSVYSLPADFTSDVVRKLPEQRIARAERKASYPARHVYPAGAVSGILAVTILVLGVPWQIALYIFLMSVLIALRIDLRRLSESPAIPHSQPREGFDGVGVKARTLRRRRVRLVEPTEVRVIRLTASISIGLGMLILFSGCVAWMSWGLTQDYRSAAEWFSQRHIYPFFALCRFWAALSTFVILTEVVRTVAERRLPSR